MRLFFIRPLRGFLERLRVFRNGCAGSSEWTDHHRRFILVLETHLRSPAFRRSKLRLYGRSAESWPVANSQKQPARASHTPSRPAHLPALHTTQARLRGAARPAAGGHATARNECAAPSPGRRGWPPAEAGTRTTFLYAVRRERLRSCRTWSFRHPAPIL